jgi:hypothetical protein
MKKHFNKRRVIVLGLVIVALAIASGVAYAYFTSAGTGSGGATVGSASGIELSSVTPLANLLYPGGDDVTVTVDVHNPGSGNQRVGTISGAVADNAGCLGSWFVVDSITFNTTVDAGTTAHPTTLVRMLDPGDNQNVCQGKTMTITWSSN